MKVSTTLALFTLGLSSLAHGMPSLPQDRRDVQVGDASRADSQDDDLAAPESPEENDVLFSWCSEYNTTDTCSEMRLKHGWCYDLGAIDPVFKNQLEDVGASEGRCMMYR
ncbi:hypothetical protein GGI35DRAFT_474983 [Trichoderma velutinum]